MRGEQGKFALRPATIAVAAACALAGALPAAAGGPPSGERGAANGQGRAHAAPGTPPATGAAPARQRSSARPAPPARRQRPAAPPARSNPRPAPPARASRPAPPARASRPAPPARANRPSHAGGNRGAARSGRQAPAPAGTTAGRTSDSGSGPTRSSGSTATTERTRKTSTRGSTDRDRSSAGERRRGDGNGRHAATPGGGTTTAGTDAAPSVDVPANGDAIAAVPPLVPPGNRARGNSVRRGGGVDAGGRAFAGLPALGAPASGAPVAGTEAGTAGVLASGEAFGLAASGAPAVVPVGRVGLAADGPLRRALAPGQVRHDFGAAPGERALPLTPAQIVEVVPGPVKAALLILAALVLGLGVRAWAEGARARRLERQRRDLLAEVGLLQTALLPEVPARLGDLVSTFAYRPAEGPAAGGDFYDAFAFDGGRVGLLVGDVAGHGRDALARTALIRYTLRAYLDAGLEPRAALKVAGSVLDDDLGSDFATVVVAVFDPASGTLTYAGAGHPPPILLGPPAHEPVTACSSPPLGAGATTGLRQTTVSLPEGSLACFFTDGLTEARTSDGLLGRDRLTRLLESLGPDARADDLLAAVTRATDSVPDDMAACVLRPDRAATGTLRVEELEVALPDLRSGAVERFLRGCGVPASDVRPLLREARDTVGSAGTAILRVRMGDWRPGVDVLPGNVEVLVRTPARLAGASRAS